MELLPQPKALPGLNVDDQRVTAAAAATCCAGPCECEAPPTPRCIGWEAVQLASAVGAPAAASKLTSGSSTPERAATAAMQLLASPSAAAGRVLRQSQSMLPQWVSGGRMPSSARRGSTHDRAGAADVTESRSARSFSTAAEAVQLAAVPKEDPNEEAARAEYLSTSGLQGACPLRLRAPVAAAVCVGGSV